MNLSQIKSAIEAGQIVHWKNPGYTVVDNGLQLKAHQKYGIAHHMGSYVGLVHTDGVTMAGDESDFYIREPECEGLQCHISQNASGAFRFDISHLTNGFVATVICPNVDALNGYYKDVVGYKPMEDYPAMTESDLVVLVAGAILYDRAGVN